MDLFKPDIFIKAFPALLSRLPLTLFIVAVATLAGFALGTAIALVRLRKIPIVSQAAMVFVSFIRGIPVLVLLFLVYIGLPLFFRIFGLNINRWDALFFVLVAYALNSAAFLSEAIRSSISGVDPRQSEAAASVGLTPLQAFRRIVLPQALRIGLPSFGNSIIGLLRDTSLAYTVGVIDIVGAITAIRIRTDRSLEAYASAAIIFFALSFLLERSFAALDRRLGGDSAATRARIKE
jgi:L-cystine transport system permease protein